MAEKKEVKRFDVNTLKDEDKEAFEYATKRIETMQKARQQPHYGVDLEALWADADRDYIPHRLGTANKKVIVTDEDKGWRGTLIRLGDSNWQSDISYSNPFIKIGIALAILIDQNPSGVFTSAAKKFEATTELIRQLYQRSWEVAESKQQLKLFVHNLAKYGWACARTYPLKITRKVKVPIEYEPDEPDAARYEKKEVVEYNDIMRENLDPRNVWIDEMTKPNDKHSMRDWCYRKVYSIEGANDEFGKYDNWKYVEDGQTTGITTETISGPQKVNKPEIEKNLIEVYFYESIAKDSFVIKVGAIPLIISPLPVSDEDGNKKMTLWHAYWNLRHALSPFGIGIYEASRYDQAFLDRLRNMTIDQITLSIYKMFFYQGTNALTDTGDIKIVPGVGKQVLDPKNINWLNVPGPGNDAYKGLEMFKKDLDEVSGITDPLSGEVTGKTAFELAQAKEAALKRLKIPLDNILDALGYEGQITITLIQLMYSIPETYTITDPELIENYLNEIGSDPELYERTTGKEGEDVFTAKVFKEFPLNLDTDEKDNLIQTPETRFFRVKPSGLKWEGVMRVKGESVLSTSKQVDKALDLEMYNMVIPLLAQPPEIYGKVVKNIIKLYDKEPREILPDHWINPQAQPLFIPAGQAQPGQAPAEAQKVVGQTQLPSQNPQGIAQKIMARVTQPFR